MGTLIAGILGSLAVSHFGGMALGGVFSRFGVAGFGPQLRISRAVYRVGKAMHQRWQEERNERARGDLLAWLAENDPGNQTGFADGVPTKETP